MAAFDTDTGNSFTRSVHLRIFRLTLFLHSFGATYIPLEWLRVPYARFVLPFCVPSAGHSKSRRRVITTVGGDVRALAWRVRKPWKRLENPDICIYIHSEEKKHGAAVNFRWIHSATDCQHARVMFLFFIFLFSSASSSQDWCWTRIRLRATEYVNEMQTRLVPADDSCTRRRDLCAQTKFICIVCYALSREVMSCNEMQQKWHFTGAIYNVPLWNRLSCSEI